MREKGKRLIAIILSCLLLLSNVTVYAATEAEAQSDTQNTVSVNASEEAVTLPEEPTNGSAGEEAVIQNEPNAEDTTDETEETETLAPINETDPLEILETPKNMVGIEMSSFTFLQTTRSVGIPTVGSTATGTCYIGDTWNVNYPYQDYFHVNNFSGDLAGAITVQDFECLDPTAALPAHKNASYEATVTEVNAAGGYVEYYVRVTPPGATDGVTRPDGEHLSGYQHVGGKVRVYRAFTGSLELIKSSANQTITNGNGCYSLKGAVYGLYQNGAEIARKTTDEKGYAKFENVTAGNYDLKEITPPKGYALDKTVLSNIYYEKGVVKEIPYMIEHLKELSDKADHIQAQYTLGKIYLKEGEFYNLEKGISYLERSASQGNEYAKYRLAKEYLNIDSKAYDPKKGISYLNELAEGGYEWAQLKMGCEYIKGEHVERNYFQAMKWLEKAVDQGNVYAEEILNDLNVRIRDMNRYGAQKGIRNNALGELDKAMVALRKSLYETQKEMRYNMMVYEQDIRAEIDGYVLEERRGLT